MHSEERVHSTLRSKVSGGSYCSLQGIEEIEPDSLGGEQWQDERKQTCSSKGNSS